MKKLSIAFVLIFFTSSVYADKLLESGFLSGEWDLETNFKVDAPNDKIIIIYNHGSERNDKPSKNCQWKNNVRNISCIPDGKYDVRLRLPRESATREYIHLLVQDVPNRDWILFHRGNTAKDTSGCILVGKGTEQDIVYNSTLSMDLLIKEIINLGGENIKLIIKNK